MGKNARHRRKMIPGADVVRNEYTAATWCPPDSPRILWRLARKRAITVRFLVAENINTPQRILDFLANDPHPMVRWAARRKQHRIPDRQHIPLAVLHSIIKLSSVKNSCEIIYRYSMLGILAIVTDGRVVLWGKMYMNRGTTTFRIERRSFQEATTVKMAKGREYKHVTVWLLRTHLVTAAHRLVYRAYKGFTPFGFDVHHIDRDTRNNSIHNLQLLRRSEHAREHTKWHIPSNARPFDQQTLERIRALFEQIFTATAVAQKTGMSLWKVRRARRQGGFYRDLRGREARAQRRKARTRPEGSRSRQGVAH